MRFYIFFLVFTFISFVVSFDIQAQEITVKRSSVVENYKGKPCYIHFVKQGETINAIAKAYNISIEELTAENPVIEKGLKADMVIRIPQKPLGVAPEAEVTNTEKPKIQTPAPVTTKEQIKPSGDPNYIKYQVKKQETLYGISKQFNVTVDDIINANPGFDGLKDGMEINIPKVKSTGKTINTETQVDKGNKTETTPDEIIVKTGETLYSIAKTYNTTVDELIGLNPQVSSGLKAGMVLKLRNTTVKTEVKPSVQREVEKPGIKSEVVNPEVQGNCYDTANIVKTYQVALLLPFLLNEVGTAEESPEQKDPSEIESFNYFQFYAGFMLAADSLQQYGLNARIQVMDAEKLDDTLTIRQALRKPGLDKMDLLVGPVYASSFTIAARYASKHKIGIVNPLSHRESIIDGNPYVIKTQVSASGIATKLTAFIKNQYPNANIIAVANDKKELKTLLDNFRTQIKESTADHSFKGTMQEAMYSTDMMAGVTKKLKPGVKNIVIFFSNSKTNVPNFVSLLNPLSKSNDIILIGMDSWDEFDLETEFLVNLNFHQVTSNYIDYESDTVQQFITRFRNKYGAVPLSTKFAFLGYDLGWYFLTSLMWYGDNYMTCLPRYQGTGLQYRFKFVTSENGDGIQNQDVNIVKLQDYKMVKAE